MVERIECAIVEQKSLLKSVGDEVKSRGGIVSESSIGLVYGIGQETQEGDRIIVELIAGETLEGCVPNLGKQLFDPRYIKGSYITGRVIVGLVYHVEFCLSEREKKQLLLSYDDRKQLLKTNLGNLRHDKRVRIVK